MKKVLNILFVITSLFLVKLVLSFTINEIIISNYNKNIYNTFLVKTLYLFNFSEPYIAYYNEGNILYRTEKYDKAYQKYEKAIKKKPPKSKVCDIRINMSLTIIKQIDSTDYKTIYNRLEEAKNNLYNNNCASQTDNSGYSKEAEGLEEEIKKLQKELNNSSSNSQSNNQQPNEKQENKEDYSDIEDELKEIEKTSNANRQSDINSYENRGNYSYYSGKKW